MSKHDFSPADRHKRVRASIAAAGLSTAAVYEDLAKPLAAQSMAIRHVPARPQGKVDLYAAWAEAQGRLK